MTVKRTSPVCHSEPYGEESAFRKRLLLVLFVSFALVPAATTVQGQPSEAAEQALRKRVEEFYSRWQVAKWGETEAYVTEETKENFRRLPKKPVLDFRIESVKLDPEGDAATVVTMVKALAAMFPAMTEMPRTSRWRLLEGVWYIEIPKTTLNPLAVPGAPGDEAPPPEELKFKGHRYHLGQIGPQQVKVARFPFTNVTDHVVTITEANTGCPCLRVLTEKKVYQPGESGELAVEFNPSGYRYDFGHTFVLVTDPGGRRTLLTVTAHVLPPLLAPAEPQGEKKPETDR